MNTDALISGLTAWVGVVIYLFLGWRLSRRTVAPETRLPAAQFAFFWLGLAAITAIGAFESLVAAFALPSLATVLTLLYLEILLICALLWALVGYLVFLFRGRSYVVGLSVVYAAFYITLLYVITASEPTGVMLSMGTVSLRFAVAFEGPTLAILLLILIAPEFIGAILYFTLFFRTRDRTVRYRVTLVSWSLIAWFGLGSLNLASLLGGSLAAQILSRSLGVFAALVILLAYYPPRALRSRYGVTGIDDVARSAG
jgi:hypothetical protein